MPVITRSLCLNCKRPISLKREWHKYCSAECRHASWEKEHPRQKIGVLTTITIGNTTYDLKNPRPAVMIGRKEDVK